MKKKRNVLKKTVAFSAAAALLTTSSFSIPVVSAAGKESKEQIKLEALDSTYGQSRLDKLREKLKLKEQAKYKPDDMVDVMVELKEDSLLENYSTTNARRSVRNAKTFEQYMASSIARTATKDIQDEQKKTLSSIKKTVDQSDSLEVLYQYSTVMNGFAVRVKYGELEKIKQLSNVKTAYVAPTFERPEPVYEKDMSSSSEMIHVQPTWDLNYKGEGQVVAILDTGLDTNHEAFQTAPTKPKYDSTLVQQVIDDKMLNADVTKASSVYVNEKVPFAYDYADGDSDVNPTEKSLVNGNSHGTHVAGTVAGDCEKLTGVAPEAQLMIFKVFPDASSGAQTADILAALEDCVRLGVDVVNMSLGSTNGFTDGSEEELSLSSVYDRIVEAGISMSVSAGNSNSASENNARNSTALASNPDTAVIGSPSTYASSTSVASVVNNKVHANYFEADGTKIAYSETASGAQPKLTKYAGQSFDYVVVPDSGEEKDYEGIDVNGKVAIITRGGITFTDKVKNAVSHGAVAAIICNNQPGTISMSIEDDVYTIPAVSVTEADGEVIKAAATKSITVKEDVAAFDTNQGTQMSDFSSWGVSPNLDLKPEIAAPGGNIYSSVPFNSYSDMSGTSMAAPHIAGTYALVKEYIRSQTKWSGLTNEEVGKLATQLLMSTSNPTKNAEGITYSPRQQGSGIVNVYNAVKTKAYLYTDKEVEVNSKPKLNLYDDVSKTGKFEQSFHIKNISDDTLSYKVSNTSLAETTETVDEELVLGETPKDVSSQVSMDVNVSNGEYADDVITVAPGQDAVVTVAFAMNEELKKYYEDNFENGEFFEGFVALSGDDGALSIPYLGFYGDWTKAPLFDSGSVYDYDVYSQAPLAACSNNVYLGVNIFDELTSELIYGAYSPYTYGAYYAEALKPDVNKIAISPNDDGAADNLDYLQLGMLRNARELSYEVKDENNEVLKSGKSEFVSKSSYGTSAMQPSYLVVNFEGLDEEENALANNSVYTVTVTGKLDYNKHASSNVKDSISIPVTVDTEAPSVSDVSLTAEEGKVYLTFKAQDNQYLSYVEMGVKEDGKRVALAEEVVNEDTKNVEKEIKVDVTEQYEKYGKKADFYVEAYDYALNETAFRLLITSEPEVKPSQSPAATPEVTASEAPVVTPSQTPSVKPSVTPSVKPSVKPSAKPGKVTGLVASELTTKSITLQWSKVSKVDGYEIYAYDSSRKQYVKAGTNNAYNNTFTVRNISGKTLEPGTKYSFKVNAYKTVSGKKVTGDSSAVLNTATRPSQTRLTVKAGTNKAILSWEKVRGANGYEVYASTSKTTGFKQVKDIASQSTVQYTKTGLKAKKTYYFKVRAYKVVDGKKIHSSFSSVKSVKVK